MHEVTAMAEDGIFFVLVVFDVASDDDGIAVESPMFLTMGITRVVLMRVKLGRGTEGGTREGGCG